MNERGRPPGDKRDGTATQAEPCVVVRETHSAVVLLVGERAYKFKKQVRFDFLNFSTREQRTAACEREVKLNRRLAPDVYQGVGEVRSPIGASMESFVLMRRMPEERRLETLVRSGEDVDEHLWSVARAMADFHSRCNRGPGVAAGGTQEAVAARWRHNLEEARAFRGSMLDADRFDAVATLAERYVSGRRALFEDRIARGAVLDGHGDLLADDIFCLPDGPRILDCLDFDDGLRHLDQIDDIACLAMDLERLGSARGPELLLDHYRELVGDHAPPSLVDHYLAYRAFMRAKVVCLQTMRPEVERAADAGRLLEIAHEHLARSAVTLVLVGGAPGTGKTTLAGALADAMGAVALSSDRTRKELAGISPETPRAAAYHRGIYTNAWTDFTYRQLLARAEKLLAMGESVVLDATWADADLRRAATEVAERASSGLVQFRCEAPLEVAERRIAERASGGSDADAEIAGRVRAGFAAWPEATTVTTTAQPARCVSRMRDRVLSAREPAMVSG